MDIQDRNKLIELYLQKKLDGMGFSQIRKELEANNLEEKDIKIIIRSIDSEVIRHAVNKSDRETGMERILIGVLLFVGGLAVTIGSYTGFFTGRWTVIAYGPILAGLAFFTQGVGLIKK